MAGHRNPLIAVGDDEGGRVLVERAYTSAMTYALTPDRFVPTRSATRARSRARENMREKTKSAGAARHSGPGGARPSAGRRRRRIFHA